MKADGEAGMSFSEWDKAAILVSSALVAVMGFYSWIVWGDSWTPLLAISSLVLLYLEGREDASGFYKPLRIDDNALLETGIVLTLFVDWVFILSPAIDCHVLIDIIGLLVFGFVIPFLFLVIFLGHSRSSIGIKRPELGLNRTAAVICVAILVSVTLRMLINGTAVLALPEVLIPLLVGSLYLGLVVGFVEEFVFRAVIQNRVAFHFRSRVAGIVLTALLFSALHTISVGFGQTLTAENIGLSLLHATMTRFPLGLVLGLVWNESEDLLGITSIHAMNNIAFLLQSLVL